MTHPFVATAREQIGKPFRHMGRGPNYFDCGGLIAWCLKQNGIMPHDLPAYGREPYDDALRRVMAKNFGQPLGDRNAMQPGDILLIQFVSLPHHVALVGDYLHGGLSMIHADSRRGKVVEHILDAPWLKNTIEVYRHGA